MILLFESISIPKVISNNQVNVQTFIKTTSSGDNSKVETKVFTNINGEETKINVNGNQNININKPNQKIIINNQINNSNSSNISTYSSNPFPYKISTASQNIINKKSIYKNMNSIFSTIKQHIFDFQKFILNLTSKRP